MTLLSVGLSLFSNGPPLIFSSRTSRFQHNQHIIVRVLFRLKRFADGFA